MVTVAVEVTTKMEPDAGVFKSLGVGVVVDVLEVDGALGGRRIVVAGVSVKAGEESVDELGGGGKLALDFESGNVGGSVLVGVVIRRGCRRCSGKQSRTTRDSGSARASSTRSQVCLRSLALLVVVVEQA